MSRKPKTQQQSWEGTPTINLYEPNREFYDSSPNVPLASISVSHVRKSPTAPTRKINYNKYYLPNQQTSDPGTYYGNTATTALRSPKSPREQTFEFELSSPPQQTRSPLKSVGSNRRYYEETPQESPARATLTSHRKYEFGAVSPKFDNPGTFYNKTLSRTCVCFSRQRSPSFKRQNLFHFTFSYAGTKKFEYFTPTKTPPEFDDPKMTNKDLNLEMVEMFGNNRNDEGSNKPSSVSPFMEQVQFQTCSPRKNRNIKKRHYNVSPDGVSSLDEYTTTTITYDTHTPSGGRRMSITISDGNSSEISSEPVLIAESLETSSLITQSTNSRTTASPLPSPSSGLSLATTATCKTCKKGAFHVVNES